MKKNTEHISRILKKIDQTEVGAEEVLKQKYTKIFDSGMAEIVGVINILTAYNDYRKLYTDMKDVAQKWEKDITCFSENNQITDLVNLRTVRNICKNNNLNEVLLLVLKICDFFLCLLSIISAINSLVSTEGDILTEKMLIPILLICLTVAVWLPIVLLAKKSNYDLIEKLNGYDEDELVKKFSNLGLKGSKILNEQIYFVQNLSKLDKLVRCYIIAYFGNIQFISQLWCVFDYLYENKIKINGNNKGVLYEEYTLKPLEYTEKEKLYNRFNLQQEIERKYLNCIGIDILWRNEFVDIKTDFNFHALDYIADRIELNRKRYENHKAIVCNELLAAFYCMVFMSANYKYSFSIEQMVSLVKNKENVNSDLKEIITRIGKEIYTVKNIKETDIRNFFEALIKKLDGYYFEEKQYKDGKRIKKYKFSYDILESFEKKLGYICTDKEKTKNWILVKLLGNREFFNVEQYFFDCSNLLVMNDSFEKEDMYVLSSYLLHMLNINNCWMYYGPILKKLQYYIMNDRTVNKKGHLKADVIKKATINNLFYSSDNESVELGMFLLLNDQRGDFSIIDIYSINIEQVEKDSIELAGYFKLLYKIFRENIAWQFEEGDVYREVEITDLEEEQYLYNVCKEFILLGIDLLKYGRDIKKFENSANTILRQSKRIDICTEANVVISIVKELIAWIRSELEDVSDKKYKNINVGMLVETMNSSMFYFIYSFFQMAIIRDRQTRYRNNNELLNFLVQSVFYFNICSYGGGITKYTNAVINGGLPINVKMNIVMKLLIRNIPCKKVNRDYIIRNMDSAVTLIENRLKNIHEKSDLENYLNTVLLYNSNVRNNEFKNKVFDAIKKQLPSIYKNGDEKIIKYLRVIFYEEWTNQEFDKIIDEINQIENSSLAIQVMQGFCKIKDEMIERIPFINIEFLQKCNSNIGRNLMSGYLKKHRYYDCDRKILNTYLSEIKNVETPSEGEVLAYLSIIDKYSEDNPQIKLNEMETYNYFVSIYLFYLAVQSREEFEVEQSYPQKTLEFLILSIESLNRAGMEWDAREVLLASYLQDRMKKNIAIEEKIIKNFYKLKPIILNKFSHTLSIDYYAMLCYLIDFPDTYSYLREQLELKEFINSKHILLLITLLQTFLPKHLIGFDVENLLNINKLLNIKYSEAI